jgi:HPr kinase/phosphorylase
MQEAEGDLDRVGDATRTKTILGVDVPNIIIPVSAGRDLVNLVETATQQQKLISSGYDPVEALSEHLRRRAGKSQPATVKRKGKNNG